MQLFCTSHKSFRNLKSSCWNNLVFSALWRSTLELIYMKRLDIKLGKERQKVTFTSALPLWKSLFSGRQILMLTSKECINCILKGCNNSTQSLKKGKALLNTGQVRNWRSSANVSVMALFDLGFAHFWFLINSFLKGCIIFIQSLQKDRSVLNTGRVRNRTSPATFWQVMALFLTTFCQATHPIFEI